MATKKSSAKKKTFKSKLSGLQIDALKEISNITTGNATSALAKVIEKKVEVRIPNAKFMNVKQITKELGGEKRMVMAIYVQVHGGLTGQSVFLFERKEALELIDLILRQDAGSTKVLDHMAESAFGEMANIFTGSYLNALSNMFGFTILPGIPVVANDYVGPILEYVWGRIENPEKETLCFQTSINVEGHNIRGDFVFMFDETSYRAVIEKLESSYGVSSKKQKKK